MQNKSAESLVRLLIAVLIITATMLLGTGERSAVLTCISLVAVVVSAYVTDTKKLFRLNQGSADAAAVVIVFIASVNAYSLDRHGLMVAAADLQSYLQYVLLFQPKTARVYWQLALLSLGQVAIASTLVPGPTFGVALLFYLVVGIATFALLVASMDQERFAGSRESSPTISVAPAAQGSGQVVLWGASPPVTDLNLGLCKQSVLIAMVTVGVTALIFFLLPRWNVRNGEAAVTEAIAEVGFSKKVTLGELGVVVNNPDLVMRVQFFTSHGKAPFKLAGEPLWRGTVVRRYVDGEWSQSMPASPVALREDPPAPYVRQSITVEPLDVNELFCVFPVFALQKEPQLLVDYNYDQLVRHEDARGHRMPFELATTGIVDDKQRQFLPCDFPLEPEQIDDLLQMPSGKKDDSDRFPGLRETAARALREGNIDPTDQAAAAMALCNFFHTSGRYSYSLEPQLRNPALDPLEDFMTEHPMGHCEYFAGALIMMLRSQGIPARMALGFKGGEWNSLGGYYQVQQLHAHAWVEAYLEKKQIPQPAFASDDIKPDAAWLTLDPTEAAQESTLASRNRGLLARMYQLFDYANVLWINYVSGLNSKRQREGVYDPLIKGASAAIDNLVSPRVWQDRFRAVANSPLGTFWQWYRRYWFSWRGGLVAGGFSLGAVGCYLASRWLVARVKRWRRGKKTADEPRVLEIYRRLEATLSARGFVREMSQTAHEFAVSAGGELADDIELRRVANLPRRIVELFYRVRFGGHPLDDMEARTVEHALVELELALVRPQ